VIPVGEIEMDILIVFGYLVAVGLYFYGLREAYDRGFPYIIAAVLLWPVSLALGITRMVRPRED
jgi:hypothetical protein